MATTTVTRLREAIVRDNPIAITVSCATLDDVLTSLCAIKDFIEALTGDDRLVMFKTMDLRDGFFVKVMFIPEMDDPNRTVVAES